MPIGRVRPLGVAFAALSLSFGLLGCPLVTRSDSVPDASLPVVPTAVTASGAKNEAQVRRYPNEVSLNDAQAIIGPKGAIVRTYPNSGLQVAALPKGTPCAKVAQYFATGVLILFNDPVGDGSTLMGWVTLDSFDTGPIPPSVKPVVKVDAGAPTFVDAGHSPTPTVVDAGHSPTPTVVDAGPPQPLPSTPCVVSCLPDAKGQCPANRKNDSGMCRVPCTKDADCPRGTKCNSRKVCSSG
jgi:hypothetical protein